MPILYKGRDIANIVKDGTNVRTRDIYGPSGITIRGAPQGQDPTCGWESPYAFGITVGNRDLATYYKASYDDYGNSRDVNIPEGVNALKVFCIGGGGGGAGGNGGHRNYNRPRDNLNWNGNWNHYTQHDAPSNGNNGAYGNYGEYRIGEFVRQGNT